MAEKSTTGEAKRQRCLAYIQQHPDGVTDTRIAKDLELFPDTTLPYHLGRLAKQGLVWRDRRGAGGKWFPVEPGQTAPPTPIGPIQARRRAQVLRLAHEQGYVTIGGVRAALGYQATMSASLLLHDLEREGFLVPCDVPPQAWARRAWKSAEHPPQAATGPSTHALAANRTQAEHALTRALDAVTDPDAHLDLDEVATRLVLELDQPIRAQIAGDLESWARQMDRAGCVAKAQVMREVSAWIARTVTTLNESL